MAIKVSKAKHRVATPPSRSLADAQDLLALTWPLDHLFQFHAELLRSVEPSISGWLNRRREGMTATLLACEKLVGCRDLNEVLSIQSELVDGAMKRLDLDVQALTEQALRLSYCAVGATQQAAQTATEMATRGAEWVARSAEPVAEAQASEDAVAGTQHLPRRTAAEPSPAAKAAA